MGIPSSPHHVMKEAFMLRLRQLYPEPPACYREEKGVRIGSVLRKPDVLLTHPDGQRWVYEMVYGNSRADHLLASHELYLKAGIHDHWILWEKLEPLSKAKPAPDDQPVLDDIGWEKKIFRLTAPQKAILDMQSGETRYIYTFTANYRKELGTFDTALGQAWVIGLVTYIFRGWAGQASYEGESRYTSILDVEFGPDGTPIPPVAGISEKLIERMIELAGIDLQGNLTTTEVNQRIAQLVHSPELQKSVIPCLIQAAAEQLSPDEQSELNAYFQSKPKIDHAFEGRFEMSDLPLLLNRFEVMRLAGVETQQALLFLEQSSIPEPMKKMMRWMMLDGQKLTSNAEFLEWQEGNEALRESR